MTRNQISFIGEEVRASVVEGAGFEKRPVCPLGFVWRGETYVITECLKEWKDYTRRGKMSHNMRPTHLAAAAKRGSRGVGRHYFRVLTKGGRIFELYYDRAPRDTVDRGGSWHLVQELLGAEPDVREDE
jgi:hypothetical protein